MRNLGESLANGALDFPALTEVTNAAGKPLPVHAPFDGRRLGHVTTSNSESIDVALTTAHGAFRDRRGWLSIPQRIEILERLAGNMASNVDELALLAASEGGKPLTDSIVEVHRAVDGIRLCIEALRGHPGQVIPLGTTPATAGRLAYTRKEPIGVVVAVSAFNHPLNLIVHQVGPAIASGCPVIVKPAADTPLSCFNFVEMVWDAGLPKAWCQAVVTDDLETAERLVTDSRVGFFSFIGSAKVGWMLRSKLAAGARCALEHGGVAPVILTDNFSLDRAIDSVLKGGFYHAGQVCVSVQRVFAPASIAESFAVSLAERAMKLTVGDPTDSATEVGPLIRHAEVDRVSEWIDEAKTGGASVLCGGKRLSDSCYAPTVLLNPRVQDRVSTQEIFGPLVCVYSYDTLDDAVAQANALPTAFQAAVFSDNIDSAMKLYSQLDASAVMINDHTAFRDDVMPFAGLRESGLGVGGIPYTFEDMQVDKMMVLKSDEIR